jgi:hypothetical protein
MIGIQRRKLPVQSAARNGARDPASDNLNLRAICLSVDGLYLDEE